MKKTIIFTNFFTSLLLFCTSTTIAATKIPDNQNIQNNPENIVYKLSERKVRERINKSIGNKFGNITRFSIDLVWPFRSQKQVDKIRLENSELREIRNIAEENIKSENNCKIVSIKKAFVKYIIQMIKKPVKKEITEWKEFEKAVPVTDFREVEKKRYDKKKLKQNIYINTIELIAKKSYDYAFAKTNNRDIAKTVQQNITSELMEKIGLKNVSLQDFLGKSRENKIDLLIEQIIGHLPN